MRKEYDIIIAGAGIGGLALAYFLSKDGYKVLCVEKRPGAGGLARCFRAGKSHLEIYYHHIFRTDEYLYGLLSELGLEGQVEEKAASTGLYDGERLVPFSKPLNLMLLPHIGLRQKLNFGLKLLNLSVSRAGGELHDVTAVKWLRDSFGEEVSRFLWEPLLRSKFGEDYSDISAAWIFERIKKRFGSRKKDKSREVLAYIKGGTQVLIDKLMDEVRGKGGEFIFGSGIESFIMKNGACMGITAGGDEFHSSKTISTVAVPEFTDILNRSRTPHSGWKDDIEDYIKRCSRIKYKSVISLVLETRKELSGYYWVNIIDETVPFPVLVNQTFLVPPVEYGGNYITYVAQYVDTDSGLLDSSPEHVMEKMRPFLEKIVPDIKEKEIVRYHVFCDRYATPVYSTGFNDIVPDLKTPVKGLFMANNTQVYPESRNLDMTVRIARKVHNLITG